MFDRLLLYGMAVFMASCIDSEGKRDADNIQKKTEEISGSCSSKQILPLPEIPLMVNSQEDANAYLVAHFWDKFSFDDSLLLSNKNIISQGLADFIRLSATMTDSREDDVRRGFQILSKGITECKGLTDSLKYYVEEFLYNPNSPYYNEKLYSIYLKEMISVIPHDNPMVSVYNFKLKLISRNCVGNKAENFYYFLPDGTKKSLYSTENKGVYTILAFYDPECHSCHDIMMRMFADREMYGAIDNGLVTVLAIYVNGNSKVWKKYLKGMPDYWIIGDDRGNIVETSLYDLKAMPTLYLLDKNNVVVLKDAPYDIIRKQVLLSIY